MIDVGKRIADRRVEARREGDRIVIGRPAADARIDQLRSKANRTQNETLELIQLRLERIEGLLLELRDRR